MTSDVSEPVSLSHLNSFETALVLPACWLIVVIGIGTVVVTQITEWLAQTCLDLLLLSSRNLVFHLRLTKWFPSKKAKQGNNSHTEMAPLDSFFRKFFARKTDRSREQSRVNLSCFVMDLLELLVG